MYTINMMIIFLTVQPEICHIMSAKLHNHSCYIFSQPEHFFSIIRNMKVPPDLLVLDYTLFNHDIFNIYDEMITENIQMPAIFYNEPCTSKLSRADFWEYMIQYEYGFLNDFDTKEYKPVLKVIQDVVESPDIRPFVPLMQKPKPLPKEFAANPFYEEQIRMTIESQLNKLHNSPGFSEANFALLQIFYANFNKTLTLQQIQEEYQKNNRDISIESVKVNISKLRSAMKKVKGCRLIILHNKTGYKLTEFI